MDSMQYPLAKQIIAGIEEASNHLPPEIEQAILQNPEILQTLTALVNGEGEQRGGARPNSGPEGNGFSHAANVSRTNMKNSAEIERNSTMNKMQLTGGNI